MVLKNTNLDDSYFDRNTNVAVVMIPVYFTDSQLQVTEDANVVVDPNVLELINELISTRTVMI